MALAQQRAAVSVRHYILAASVLVLATALATPLRQVLDLANIVMLYLLVVFLVALNLGRGPAVFSALLAVLLFDFFFVPPRISFAVDDIQYLVTFAVMLTVGLISSHLTGRLREQSAQAIEREQQTHLLYRLARELAGTGSQQAVMEVLKEYLAMLGYRSAIYLIDAQGQLPALSYDVVMQGLAETALRDARAINIGQLQADGQPSFVVPIKSAETEIGVLVAHRGDGREMTPAAEAGQLEAICDLAAIALERLRYVELAQAHELEAVSERLRSSILSALSHDLRTPLTGLVGMSDALARHAEGGQEKVASAAAAIREQALTMNGLISNLLDMARLYAGKVELRREWQLFEDVIGAAVKLVKPALAEHPIRVELAPDLPLVSFDAILIERVLCNLLENAAKYSPAGRLIEIRGYVDDGVACLSVRDHGPGFPIEHRESLFRMFTRGETESSLPGAGLGLAICKAIMDAHQGTITVGDAAEGAVVTIALPLGTPPALPDEMENT